MNINTDYKEKYLIIQNNKIKIMYNDVLINTERCEHIVLKALYNLKSFSNLDVSLPLLNVLIIDKKLIDYYINNGFVIIISDKVYAVECRTKINEDALSSEKGMLGSNTSFTKVFNDNLYLIRNRIKSNKLKSLSFDMGSLSKTKCSILYIDGIANKNLVKKVYKKLNKIKIDGVLDSCYLKDYLNKFSLFPVITSTMRPDKASSSLLEGKIVIIADNSINAIVLPNIFIDFFHTMDDYYTSYILSSFIRIIRLIAFIISIFLPSIYVLLYLNNNSLIRISNKNTLLDIFIQNIFLIVIFNILRESDLHKNSNNASSFSLLGGLVFGTSASLSKFVSPISLIIVSLSTISTLVFDSYEFQNTINILKIIVLILTWLLGAKGLIISTIFIFVSLLLTKTFNVYYLYPFIPFNKKSIIDTFLRIRVHNKYRNKVFTNNIKRGKI